MTTTTETNDVEALLTVITKEDLEGTIAQLRAAINVFVKNPRPSIAENAQSLVESALTKAKNITAHALAAHKTFDDLEKHAEAKAFVTLNEEKQKWSAYANHLKEQLATCNRELAQSKAAPAQGRGRPAETQTPFIQPETGFTPTMKSAVRETIRKSWLKLQDPLSYLLRFQEPITGELIRQTMPLEQLGLHYTVHNVIYHALYKSLLDERERLHTRGSNARLSDSISNVFHAMMNAVGY